MIGRHLPTEAQPTPTLYRMTIFAPNTSVAKSRYWYFLRGLKKVKKGTGEIVSVKEVCGSSLLRLLGEDREDDVNEPSTNSSNRRSRRSTP